jgi:DNA-binding HxlR family transcriptional regulator
VKGEGSGLDIVEDIHSMRVLLKLKDEGRMVRSVLYARLPSAPNTSQKRIDRMIDAGLISEVEEPFPPKRKWVELTDKGRQVAEKLAEIEKILGD